MGKKQKRAEKKKMTLREVEAMPRQFPVTTFSRLGALISLMDTAIWLWFSGKDPLSIHLLAMSCYRCLEILGEEDNKGPIIEKYFDHTQFNLAYDFLRHCSSSLNDVLDFPSSLNGWLLFDCVDALERIYGRSTVFMNVFRAYFSLNSLAYPQKGSEVRNFFPPGTAEKEFAGLSPRDFWAKLVPAFTGSPAPPLG